MIDDGEALRRRLYRPGAGGSDVDAYLAVAELRPAPGPPPPPERRPRGWAVLVAVVVALLVAGILLPRAWDRTTPTAAPTPLPTGSVPAATGARFIAALETGHDAGLGAWFAPGAPVVEQHGTGDAVIELPPSGSDAGGSLEVLLVLDADGTAGWQTARLVITRTHAVVRDPEAGATGALRAGVPTLARVVYPVGDRPLRLLVRAPAGTRWGVAAVFTR